MLCFSPFLNFYRFQPKQDDLIFLQHMGVKKSKVVTLKLMELYPYKARKVKLSPESDFEA